jgi:hypothetical protein
VLPVDESGAQGSGGFLDTVCWNQHDRGTTRDGRGKMPVFGQQHPILFNATQGECSVGKPAFGNDRVITGRNHRPRSRSISSHINRGNGLTLSL